MELKHTTDWYNDLQSREGKVVDNIRKSVGNEAEGKPISDSGVQVEHKGLTECSEDELVALLAKTYSSMQTMTDGPAMKIAGQHLELIKTELKKRKSDNSSN